MNCVLEGFPYPKNILLGLRISLESGTFMALGSAYMTLITACVTFSQDIELLQNKIQKVYGIWTHKGCSSAYTTICCHGDLTS